jgi:hypothetical protein
VGTLGTLGQHYLLIARQIRIKQACSAGWAQAGSAPTNAPMTKKTKIVMTAWSVLVLILVLVNILIGLGNQSVQAEVTERQQEIAQTIQLEALNRQLVTVLASMAVKTNDAQLKKLLADSGVNVGDSAEAAPQNK